MSRVQQHIFTIFRRNISKNKNPEVKSAVKKADKNFGIIISGTESF
jgi:hypothetical protein